jgi:N-acetylglucosaminyldiphosphoundecaprenol N-acetyl-beta-D-mannosaminyltransferase
MIDTQLILGEFLTSKRELWLWNNRENLNVGLMISVGAAIPFYAGTEQRAPRWMQKIGLEWAFRVLKEPKRLGKRYFKDLVFFKYFVLELKNRYF